MTAPGAVLLTASDPGALREFYERVLGLETIDGSGELVSLGAGGEPLVELAADPSAPPRPAGATGLFHLAILVPDRPQLGRALRRVAEAGGRLTGASDHLVSEALYLYDPEGNGIEIYRDRPRDEWRYENGELQMATLPLDLEAILEAGGDSDPGPRAPDGARMGHVHLQVADLARARDFYEGLLGLDVTVETYPGALFLSSGGYHHHIGLNTWAGEGAPAPPPGSRGLCRYELVMPPGELEGAAGRLEEAGADAERTDDGLETADPSGNRVLLSTPS